MALSIREINGKIEAEGLKVFISREGNKSTWRVTDTNEFIEDIVCRISDKNATEWVEEANRVWNDIQWKATDEESEIVCETESQEQKVEILRECSEYVQELIEWKKADAIDAQRNPDPTLPHNQIVDLPSSEGDMPNVNAEVIEFADGVKRVLTRDEGGWEQVVNRGLTKRIKSVLQFVDGCWWRIAFSRKGWPAGYRVKLA